MNRAPFIERVRDLLNYDAQTGEFTWRYTRQGVPAGPAGSYSGNGYLYITIDLQKYSAHRLAWLYVHGKWPNDQIDHINGNRADNRLINLREVTGAVNNQNQRRARTDNKSCGLLGVSKNRDKWRARIWLGGVERCLGSFPTPEEAHKAYLKAKRKLHPGCEI